MQFMSTDPIAHACHDLTAMERYRQVSKGYTVRHDAEHGALDFNALIEERLGETIQGLEHPEMFDAQAVLKAYMQIAAVAEAAMYQIIAHNPEVLNG